MIELVITVIFWGDAPPLRVPMETSLTECTPESVKQYTKLFEVLQDRKLTMAECINKTDY